MTLNASAAVPRETHRIMPDRIGESLFINDPSRPAGEYLYGKLVRVEPRRFQVGHKTYVFNDEARSQGFVVHVNEQEVRVAKLSCR